MFVRVLVEQTQHGRRASIVYIHPASRTFMHFTARLIKIYSQNLTMSQTSKINRKSLADMNKEIFEFKKKIQLSGNVHRLRT
jgi:hypothetical protein